MYGADATADGTVSAMISEVAGDVGGGNIAELEYKKKLKYNLELQWLQH